MLATKTMSMAHRFRMVSTIFPCSSSRNGAWDTCENGNGLS